MNAIQGVCAGLALVGGLILYVVGGVIPEPPVWASLFAREPVTVVASTVEMRQTQPPALPVIDVRIASGETVVVDGYGWMDEDGAQAISAAHPVGAQIKLPHWDGKVWRGLSGLLDALLLGISVFAAFIIFFGLWMMWKLRRA
jgi:hypothetical protein